MAAVKTYVSKYRESRAFPNYRAYLALVSQRVTGWNAATAARFKTFIEDSWAGEIKASAIAEQINQILSAETANAHDIADDL